MNCQFLCVFIFLLGIQSSHTFGALGLYPSAFVSSIHQFSADFYQTLAKHYNGNFISSPFSVLTGLSILAQGAEGNSREELIRAIHLPIYRKSVLENFRRLISHLYSVPGVKLHLTNKLSVENTVHVQEAFENVTNIIFKSKIESINSENAHKAFEKINNSSRQGTIDEATNIVRPSIQLSANPVYFKGRWEHGFDNDLTEQAFYLSENNSIIVPNICNNAEYNHGDILNSTATYIELPYKTDNDKNDFSMFIIIPNEIDGLNELEHQIDEIKFANLNNSRDNVHICIPRFEIESKINLIPSLEYMGIHDIFNNYAKFSNIDRDNDNLRVGEFIQNAYFSVNAYGTDVFATHVIAHNEPILTDNIPQHNHNVNVDRPFNCVIVSKASGIPLLWARVVDPR